jgi:Domain of unknown function (DUF892)
MPQFGINDVRMHARLIAAGQRAEQHEMAAYGTLVARVKRWARRESRMQRLEQTLSEAKAADAKLTEFAEGGINHRRLTRWKATKKTTRGKRLSGRKRLRPRGDRSLLSAPPSFGLADPAE